MDTIITIQRWLYGGMSAGLRNVASGRPSAVIATIALAVLFGAPDATNTAMLPTYRHIDKAMVTAIARVFRWRERLASGRYQVGGFREKRAESEKNSSSDAVCAVRRFCRECPPLLAFRAR